MFLFSSKSSNRDGQHTGFFLCCSWVSYGERSNTCRLVCVTKTRHTDRFPLHNYCLNYPYTINVLFILGIREWENKRVNSNTAGLWPPNIPALLQFPWSGITCESSHRHRRTLSSNKKLTVQPELFLTFIATWFMANPQISRWLQDSEGVCRTALWFAVYCDRPLFQCRVYILTFTAPSHQKSSNCIKWPSTVVEHSQSPLQCQRRWLCCEKGSPWGSDA